MIGVVYDAGILVAADRAQRMVWADHKARLEAGILPVTTAPVVAQVSRSSRQVGLRRFLRGCDVAPFVDHDAHRVGELLGASGLADVIDAHVVVVAATSGAIVVTGDARDLVRLVAASGVDVRVVPLPS